MKVFVLFNENVEMVRKNGIVDFVLKGEVIAIKGRHRVEKAVIRQARAKRRVDAIIIAMGLLQTMKSLKTLDYKPMNVVSF